MKSTGENILSHPEIVETNSIHDEIVQSIPREREKTDTRLPGLLVWALGLPFVNRLGLERRPQELMRFLKFATVGVIGMVVDFTVLNLMHLVFGLPLWAANTVSFSAAVLSNFTWNRLWTFPESRERPLGRQLLQFAAVNIAGWAINTGLLLGLDKVLVTIIPEPWSYNLAKVFAIGVVLFWNYFINRKWTYRGIE
jgi:putative flippase GtrA